MTFPKSMTNNKILLLDGRGRDWHWQPIKPISNCLIKKLPMYTLIPARSSLKSTHARGSWANQNRPPREESFLFRKRSRRMKRNFDARSWRVVTTPTLSWLTPYPIFFTLSYSSTTLHLYRRRRSLPESFIRSGMQICSIEERRGGYVTKFSESKK